MSIELFLGRFQKFRFLDKDGVSKQFAKKADARKYEFLEAPFIHSVTHSFIPAGFKRMIIIWGLPGFFILSANQVHQLQKGLLKKRAPSY
ncbi:hypothetical protein SAMN05428978_1008105 [Nitrosomonas sp. Nm34]|nr:hypothetical protein SAMN05428978_1008105 [Nitrosomonas sp. Nm34]